MSQLSFPLITNNTNVTVDSKRSNYIIAATANLTYTLPSITANGINYTFSRIDNNQFTVSITVSPGDLISESVGVTVSSIVVGTSQSLELISLNGVWYVTYKSNNSIAGSSYFTAWPVSSNGNPYVASSFCPNFDFIVNKDDYLPSRAYVLVNVSIPGTYQVTTLATTTGSSGIQNSFLQNVVVTSGFQVVTLIIPDSLYTPITTTFFSMQIYRDTSAMDFYSLMVV